MIDIDDNTKFTINYICIFIFLLIFLSTFLNTMNQFYAISYKQDKKTNSKKLVIVKKKDIKKELTKIKDKLTNKKKSKKPTFTPIKTNTPNKPKIVQTYRPLTTTSQPTILSIEATNYITYTPVIIRTMIPTIIKTPINTPINTIILTPTPIITSIPEETPIPLTSIEEVIN